MKDRRTLLLVIGIGLFCHATLLFVLNYMPIRTPVSLFQNTIQQGQTLETFASRQERTQMLAEIFTPIRHLEPEVKEEFHTLHAEYAPSIEIALQPHLPEELESAPFSFQPDIHPTLAEGELTIPEGTPLIVESPQVTSIELPPLAEVEYSDDPYTAFGTLAGSEHFDIAVEYAPKRSRPGYVFKVTFTPREEIVFKRIRQNVYFLIDRSNSIPRARYALNKQVVAQSLDHLQEGDTFNILIFDGRVVRLAPEPVAWSEKNVAQARTFLERQGHGGLFAATDLYASLGKIIPQDISDHEVHTAILLSDGDTYLSREKQRQLIGEWTRRNDGKVALYTVATGSGNNVPLLELISSFNQGRLFYAQDHNELPQLMRTLLEGIRSPIGKEMRTTAITADAQTTVLLQPKEVRLPDLYQGRPFVVYGSTNRLTDFVLFLQGKYYDRRFDIKKRVSFENTPGDAFSIERKWTQLLAHEFYMSYFKDGNTKHLEAAKELLVPLNLSTPWID